MTTPQTSNGKKKGKQAPPPNETKRQRFARIINRRTQAAIKAIRTIGLVGSNRSSYEYDQSDVDKIRSTLTNAMNEMAGKMRRPSRQVELPFDIDGTGEVS